MPHCPALPLLPRERAPTGGGPAPIPVAHLRSHPACLRVPLQAGAVRHHQHRLRHRRRRLRRLCAPGLPRLPRRTLVCCAAHSGNRRVFLLCLLLLLLLLLLLPLLLSLCVRVCARETLTTAAVAAAVPGSMTDLGGRAWGDAGPHTHTHTRATHRGVPLCVCVADVARARAQHVASGRHAVATDHIVMTYDESGRHA